MVRDRNIIFVISYLDRVKDWIDPIHPFLKEAKFRVYILHMQSLSFGFAKEHVQVNPDYTAIDIGKLSTYEITKLIKEINPVVINSFTFRSLYDILLLRISQVIGYKTVLIQHGLIIDEAFVFTAVNKISSFKRYYWLCKKLFQFLIGLKIDRISEFSDFYSSIAHNDFKSIKHDYCILYSEYYFQMMKKHIHFNPMQVHYSGFPLAQKESDLINTNDDIYYNTILFIHQPLNKVNYVTDNTEIEYLKNISKICNQNNYQMILRMHPRDDADLYHKELENSNVRLDIENNLIESVRKSDLILGQYSTALYAAIILKKPIVITYYPGYDMTNNVFSSVAMFAKDGNELDEIIKRKNVWNNTLHKYDQYIEKYVGNYNSYESQIITLTKIVEQIRLEHNVKTS